MPAAKQQDPALRSVVSASHISSTVMFNSCCFKFSTAAAPASTPTPNAATLPALVD